MKLKSYFLISLLISLIANLIHTSMIFMMVLSPQFLPALARLFIPFVAGYMIWKNYTKFYLLLGVYLLGSVYTYWRYLYPEYIIKFLGASPLMIFVFLRTLFELITLILAIILIVKIFKKNEWLSEHPCGHFIVFCYVYYWVRVVYFY